MLNQVTKCDLSQKITGIKKYYELNVNKSDVNSYIDNITWTDLEMDDIFAHVNHTVSSAGEQFLYGILHNNTRDENILYEREKYIKLIRQIQSIPVPLRALCCQDLRS